MTRIRRINVSQVEGDGADNTSIGEIRPFGETGFYIDNNNKLTLLMFDGVRTHRDSKVLSPGVLWGSNADAGDGSGADTIKLIPDSELFANGSDQYIVVDPTEGGPGHIHIRAGGIQDSSGADLYIGGEQTFVRVSDINDDVTIRTSVLGEGIFPYSWTFDNGGKLTLPGTLEYANGTLATGGGLVTPPGTDYIIGTQQLQTVSANCAIAAGDEFVADIEFNDDIIVVQLGWTVVVDGSTYTVTSIDPAPPANQYRITAAGAPFVQSTTYTFTNPSILAYDWSFGLDGVLSTPGLGTISHRNNDLKVEVSGSDVIVLRTAGGNLILNANASLTFSDGVSTISAVDPAQSGGISGLSVNGKDRTYIGISGNEYGYNWDFRAFGVNDETTAKPTIKFPGNGWLQEDISNLGTGGFDVPTQLGSQGAFTLTVKDNSTFPGPAPTYNWTFGTDGSTTFPDATVQTTAYTGTGAITFTGNEIQGNTFGGTGSIITKTVDANGDSYSTGGGSIGFLNFGADGNIQNVKAGWTVTFASGETRTVSLDAWQPLGTYWNISFDSAYNWSAGDVMPVTFSSPDYAAGTAPQVTLAAGTESWTFDDAGTLTLPAGMTVETAYGGGPRLVIDGKANYVDIRSDGNILIGYNESGGNVIIGNGVSGIVDIAGPKFRVQAPVPTASTGAAGDQAGQVAFNGSYIYYCVANYTDGLSNIWKRVAWSADTW